MQLLALASAMLLAGCAAVPAPSAPQAAPSPPPVLAPWPAPVPAAPEPAITAPSSPGRASANGRAYACQDGSTFRVFEQNDFIVIEGLRGGPHRLARDAGGFTPQHSVWSSAQLRAEFGLGNDPKAAALIHTLPPATVRCAAG